MDILAIVAITALFAAIGFFIAMRLSPNRTENRDRFLMTALLCVSLAIVVSGLVRKPVVKMIRSGQNASVAEVLDRNELFLLVQEAAPEVAADFKARAVKMHDEAKAEGVVLSFSDWEASVILWEKLVEGGVGMAPDEAAVLFAQGLSTRLRALAEHDPQKAIALLSPRSFMDADPAIFTLTGDFGKGMKAVVLGAYQSPADIADDQTEAAWAFERAMADFVAHLEAERGQAPDLEEYLNMLDNPKTLQENAAPALPLLIADMLDFLLDRPEEERAALIKHMFSASETD